MRRAIVIEIECDADTFSVADIERGIDRAIVSYFDGSRSRREGIDILHLECANGTLKEAFGIGFDAPIAEAVRNAEVKPQNDNPKIIECSQKQ